MAYFTAKHTETETSWKLATQPNLRGEVMLDRAKNFARNWCKKRRLTGEVVLTQEDAGEEISFFINDDFSI